jgi:hypothetical protein
MTDYIGIGHNSKGPGRFRLESLDPGRLERLRDFPQHICRTQQREDWYAAIMCDGKVTAIAALLGIAIVGHLNLKTQRCFPPQFKLAARIGRDARTIIRLARRLEKLGWLRVTRHKHSPGRQGRLANEYHPTIPAELKAQIAEHQRDIAMISDRSLIVTSGTGLSDILESYSDIAMSPQPVRLNREDTTFRTSYGVAGGNASLEDPLRDSQEGKEDGATRRERSEASPRGERSDPARPYSLSDIEVLQQVLNGASTTYAGIIDASRQPGALGDSIGIDPPSLRNLLDDCMRLRLVGTERRNGRDYFWMTDVGIGLDWAEVLGLR